MSQLYTQLDPTEFAVGNTTTLSWETVAVPGTVPANSLMVCLVYSYGLTGAQVQSTDASAAPFVSGAINFYHTELVLVDGSSNVEIYQGDGADKFYAIGYFYPLDFVHFEHDVGNANNNIGGTPTADTPDIATWETISLTSLLQSGDSGKVAAAFIGHASQNGTQGPNVRVVGSSDAYAPGVNTLNTRSYALVGVDDSDNIEISRMQDPFAADSTYYLAGYILKTRGYNSVDPPVSLGSLTNGGWTTSLDLSGTLPSTAVHVCLREFFKPSSGQYDRAMIEAGGTQPSKYKRSTQVMDMAIAKVDDSQIVDYYLNRTSGSADIEDWYITGYFTEVQASLPYVPKVLGTP